MNAFLLRRIAALCAFALIVPFAMRAATTPVAVRDLDNDGMDDAWELSQGLSPSNAADANSDPDGDGFSNLVEYWCGTNARSAMARPLLSIDLVGGKPKLGWPGVLGKRYQIEFTSSLAAGTWTTLGDPLVGTGGVLQASDTISGGLVRSFYRVRTLPSFDRDGDGLDDWLEVAVYHSNPDRSSSSGTGVPDGWAVRNGLDPATVAASADSDGDGAGNLAEYLRGTDPLVADPPVGDSVVQLRVFTPLGL